MLNKHRRQQGRGSLAQLGEHLPYKQRVTGSSPVTPTTYGLVVQLVRTLACHARGRGFEPHPGRQPILGYAFVAQLVEQRTENPRVVGSIPTEGTIRGFSSSGRAPPCQGGGSEFEPRNPLHRPTSPVGLFFCSRKPAGLAHPVERHLPKVDVASSSLVTRSNL